MAINEHTYVYINSYSLCAVQHLMHGSKGQNARTPEGQKPKRKNHFDPNYVEPSGSGVVAKLKAINQSREQI